MNEELSVAAVAAAAAETVSSINILSCLKNVHVLIATAGTREVNCQIFKFKCMRTGQRILL
jgi:hypothetical protein